MKTSDFIAKIRDNSRAEWNVALRFALYNYLYKNRIPVQIMASIMGVRRGSIYNGIYQHRQKLSMKDRISLEAENEILQHKVCVRPSFVEVNQSFVKPNGNVMIIDDIIY